MAIMPGANVRLLANASKTRMSAYDIICIHTMVGSLSGTDGYFRGLTSGINSHFGTGGLGELRQWVDTLYRSGANMNGNHRIVSIECADMGPGFAAWNTKDGGAVPSFTDAQVEAIAQIVAWACRTHNIPCEIIPDAKPGRRGIAYHRQGVPGYAVAGAEMWSSARGKVCPGDRRIAQIPRIILRARQILVGVNPTSRKDDDPMAADSLHQNVKNEISVIVKDWVTKVLKEAPLVDWAGSKNAPATIPAQLRMNAEGLALAVGEIRGLREVVGQLSAGTNVQVDLEAVSRAAAEGARSVIDDLRVVPAAKVDETP